MRKIYVTLLKPLDGMEIGTRTRFDEVDVKRLEDQGAVERVGQKARRAAKTKSAPKPTNKARITPADKSAG